MVTNSEKDNLLKEMESFIGKLKKLGNAWEYAGLNRWFLRKLASVLYVPVVIGEDYQMDDLQEKSDMFIKTFGGYWNSDPRKRVTMIKIAMQNIQNMRNLLNELRKEEKNR